MRRQHPRTPRDLALRLAVKALNDTMGPHGLVPSLLVFSALPTCPAPLQHKPRQVDRFKALNAARREMEASVAEQHIRLALTSKLPLATRFNLEPGQQVRVYREEHRRWIGPYNKVARISDKQVYITDGKTTRPFNITHVIPATAISKDTDWKQTLRHLDNQTDHHITSVFLVEILKRNDPRFYIPECQQAIIKENNVLL